MQCASRRTRTRAYFVILKVTGRKEKWKLAGVKMPANVSLLLKVAAGQRKGS